MTSPSLSFLVPSRIPNIVPTNNVNESDSTHSVALQNIELKFPQGELSEAKKQQTKLIKAFETSLLEEKYPYVQTCAISSLNGISEFSQKYAEVLIHRSNLSALKNIYFRFYLLTKYYLTDQQSGACILLTQTDNDIKEIDHAFRYTEFHHIFAYVYDDENNYGKPEDSITLFNSGKRNIIAINEESPLCNYYYYYDINPLIKILFYSNKIPN